MLRLAYPSDEMLSIVFSGTCLWRSLISVVLKSPFMLSHPLCHLNQRKAAMIAHGIRRDSELFDRYRATRASS